MAGCDRLAEELHSRFELSKEVNACLRPVGVKTGTRAGTLGALNRALKARPNRLETLIALYQFHCDRGNLDDAEDAVFQTLVKAAQQGRFDHDWNQLDRYSTDWNTAHGPGRIYLLSLKTLAFIRLRQEMLFDARKILDSLARIDPDDRVGASVVRNWLEDVNEH